MDKIILLLLSMFGMYLTMHDNLFLVCLYLSIIYSGVNYYLIIQDKNDLSMKPSDKSSWFAFILELIVCIPALVFPPAVVILPLVMYDMTRSRNYIGFLLSVMAFINTALTIGKDDSKVTIYILLYTLALSALSILMSIKTERSDKTYQELKRVRDDDAEVNTRLRLQNNELLNARDTEIHNAQLAERNRIAREIHDNVGHMLSRALLQMGALLSIHKEEPIHSQLEGVRETLDTAMNNIRSSVHDLHDDSIDVKANIIQMAKPLEDSYKVNLDIDISDDMPRNIKYACIGITKECISNIIKHSHNKNVDISLSEHPSFYQLVIHDYGSRDDKTVTITGKNAGMGLENIRSRVESVNGSLNISTSQGFRVFVSIPK